jgi:hypothetical protein
MNFDTNLDFQSIYFLFIDKIPLKIKMLLKKFIILAISSEIAIFCTVK